MQVLQGGDQGLGAFKRGHDAGREPQGLAARVGADAKAAQLGDDLGGGQGLGQAQHHRAAAFCLGARGDQRQMHLVRGRDQPCGQAAVMGQKRCVILARVPIQRWQRGKGCDGARRAIVKAANVGGIGKGIDIPRKRVVLAEPAARFGLGRGNQSRGHIKHTRAGGAAHPFQRGRDREIHRGCCDIIGDQPGGLSYVAADQRAHAAAMRDHRIKINAVA